MRAVLCLCVVGCAGPATDPIGSIDPPADLGGRILATWDVYDAVGLTDCPEEYVVRLSAPEDTEALFPCSDQEGVMDPAPPGQYVLGMDLLDANGELLQQRAYGVRVITGSDSEAYTAYNLP
jgi:hypothetical protein